MPSAIACCIFTAGIIALLILERSGQQRSSYALWIPAIYFFIVASRPVSAWLGLEVSSAQGIQDGSPVDALVYTSLYVLAAAVLVSRRARVAKLLHRAWPVVLFFLYCLISLIWSDSPVVALKRWVKLVGDLIIVLVVVSDPSPCVALKRFLAWPGLVLLPLSVLFIKYYPYLGKYYDPWTGTQFFAGASYNKNGLGAICLFWGIAFVWILAAGFAEGRVGRRLLTMTAVALAMCVWLLQKSDSATSLSCLLMGTILVLMSRIRVIARNPVIIHCTVITMIAATFTALFVDTSALGLLQRDPTLTGRTELWDVIFSIPVNPLIGTGYESFWTGWRIESIWKVFWWHPTQAHNGFIEIFVNLGAIGLGILGLMLLVAYSRAVNAVSRGEVLGSVFLAYIVMSVPYNYTEATFRIQNLAWLFVLLALTGTPGPRARRTVNVADSARFSQGAQLLRTP